MKDRSRLMKEWFGKFGTTNLVSLIEGYCNPAIIISADFREGGHYIFFDSRKLIASYNCISYTK